MEVLRTPDERFEGLTDYDFAPHYRRGDGRGTGPRSASTSSTRVPVTPPRCYCCTATRLVLPLPPHDPGLVARGHRVVALDLMGMGRSDKPVDQGEFTLARHVDWMGQWLVARGPDRHHPVLPGLGRDRRAQPAAAPRRPVRPGGGLQHRPPGGRRA